jgi:hypothetical protein
MDKLASMASAAAPIFAYAIEDAVWRVIYLVFLLLGIVAFVHCALQQSDAFSMVGRLSKSGWLLINAGALAVEAISVFLFPLSLLAYVSIIATVFYLLEVRTGLRDVSGGQGRLS